MFDVEEEGYLIDPMTWSEQLAEALALEEGIELTRVHWQAILFMRDYYAEQQVVSDVRHVTRHLAEHHGYAKQTCRIVGMKRSRAWSTG